MSLRQQSPVRWVIGWTLYIILIISTLLISRELFMVFIGPVGIVNAMILLSIAYESIGKIEESRNEKDFYSHYIYTFPVKTHLILSSAVTLLLYSGGAL